MSTDEINQKIEELKNQLGKVRGRQIEVYQRIVGYHRAIDNWNSGKQNEYKDRVTFDKIKKTS